MKPCEPYLISPGYQTTNLSDAGVVLNPTLYWIPLASVSVMVHVNASLDRSECRYDEMLEVAKLGVPPRTKRGRARARRKACQIVYRKSTCFYGVYGYRVPKNVVGANRVYTSSKKLSTAAIRPDMVFIVIIDACRPCGPCTSV